MTITATASASSSSLLECTASCTYVGVMRAYETWCASPTGDQYYYDRPSATNIQTIAVDPWIVPEQVPFELPRVPLPVAICPPPPGNATDFPADHFKSVYTKFCKELEANNGNAATTVNWKGDRHPSLKSRLLRFLPRDDASDDAKYKHHKFMLARYVRDGSNPACSVTCEVAFERFSSQNLCLRGDGNKEMASTGILDTVCALYSMSAAGPRKAIRHGIKKCLFLPPITCRAKVALLLLPSVTRQIYQVKRLTSMTLRKRSTRFVRMVLIWMPRNMIGRTCSSIHLSQNQHSTPRIRACLMNVYI